MPTRLQRIAVENYRSLATIDLDIEPLNVFFGPNGAGKSTLLDTVWFIRDCAIRGVEFASSDRSHGIGALCDGASEGSNISISLETSAAEYQVAFGYSNGRIEPFVAEVLKSKARGIDLIDRKLGTSQASFYHSTMDQSMLVALREPEKLALTKYVDFDPNSTEASEIDRLLHFVHFYHARSADFYGLKKRGSDSSHQTYLWDRYQNLWSVLRNLHDRQSVDDRYLTIITLMREAFPTFKDLLIEQTGPESVYGNFLEVHRRHPIKASGVSDGHLQMLAHLTALFSEGRNRDSLLLLDEPEISLHPFAIAILAKAIRIATSEWNKQVLVATHSPVLISQFEATELFATMLGSDGNTTVTRVSELADVQDLIQEYSLGSLYMAEAIAAQSEPQSVSTVANQEPPTDE